LLALIGPGCQIAFGTYTAGSSDAGVPVGGRSGIGGATSVSGGTAAGGSTVLDDCDGTVPFKCTGAELWQCVNKHWDHVDTCNTAGNCQKGLGVCYKCAKDDPPQCSADRTAILTCADPLVGFTVAATCVAPQICAPGNTSCVLCETGQTRCEVDDAGVAVDKAKRCVSTTSGWVTIPCSGPCLQVDGFNDNCRTCNAGETACANRKETDGSTTNFVKTCVSDGSGWATIVCPKDCVPGSPGIPATCAVVH
jgi:hypothetical protein